MSQENIEKLREGYEAFNRGGPPAALASPYLDPEIEVIESEAIPDSDTYQGKLGLKELLESLADTFEGLRFDPEEFVDVGDRVLVLVRMTGRGKGSGIEIDELISHLWTDGGGRAIRLQAFNDWQQALTAVGLDAQA
jgi:ketosteroid isomerase-like protein